MFKNALSNPQIGAEKPRYDVYIYHKRTGAHRMEKWERLTMTHSIKRAVKYAKLLRQRHVHVTIEIKKKFYCVQEQRIIGKTVRVYKNTKQSWLDFFGGLTANA